jgi:C1A family cysteine protease
LASLFRATTMRLFAVLVVAAVAVSALSELDYQNQFVGWMNQFDKQYNHEEFFARYNTFKGWVDFVQLHNAGNFSWKAGLNQFSDLSPAEFQAQMLSGLDTSATDLITLPESEEVFEPANDVDWRTKGAVTPVKNQGQCGSCWAFSAIGMIEGWYAVTSGKLLNLAEQQLVDCAGSYGNQGCNGGWHDKAVDYSASSGGSCIQTDYPYTARTGTCRKTCTPQVTPHRSQMGTTESALSQALERWPVGVAVDASGGFQSYHSGVFNGPCGQNLNHAILAVGFSSASGGYWIVKNSWGTTWGASGYIHMAQGKNLCGINKHTAWVSP